MKELRHRLHDERGRDQVDIDDFDLDLDRD
jgi:hypothetical protein